SFTKRRAARWMVAADQGTYRGTHGPSDRTRPVVATELEPDPVPRGRDPGPGRHAGCRRRDGLGETAGDVVAAVPDPELFPGARADVDPAAPAAHHGGYRDPAPAGHPRATEPRRDRDRPSGPVDLAAARLSPGGRAVARGGRTRRPLLLAGRRALRAGVHIRLGPQPGQH